MEISKLKELCYSEDEAKYASFVYSYSLKRGLPFTVSITSKNDVVYTQSYTKNGAPIGKLTKMLFEDL